MRRILVLCWRERQERHPEQKAQGWGDVCTGTGFDANTKLCIGYLAGGHDGRWTADFVEDCASRIKGRVQITTDGHEAYQKAVEGAFGMDLYLQSSTRFTGTE